MEKKEGKDKSPIQLFGGLALAVVALGLAVYFYFWMPTPAPSDLKQVAKEIVEFDRQGKELAAAKKFDEAIAQYNKALTINPNDDDVLMDRALAYYKKKEFQLALADYELVLANSKKETGAPEEDKSNDALFSIALCQSELEHTELAIKGLHELQSKDSHYIKSYQLLGDIYFKHGDSERAIDVYTQGLRINPNSAPLHYDRSLAYQARGMKETAFEDLSMAVDLDKTSLPFRLKHANMAQLLGKLAIADSDARAILLIEPDNHSALSWLKHRKIPQPGQDKIVPKQKVETMGKTK